nr:immunoglobulin heavy chain junction region [Mus musculus]MBK4188465.1 immunoglobulin heavy chain junction region [Mus musculus]MBK4188466.1 immunoglobulin heavy chain junction region [Mus musculus]MBK4188467.1 immunoglobulin heavy chain junction region [Mus musculus]MBK4188468.1 immunoglobulin heavy chain junction region [Mus musculus]
CATYGYDSYWYFDVW